MIPNKKLGQHWLHDQPALKHICDMAALNAHDTVLEVGPGKGTLTKELLARGAHVIAVEIDEKLYRQLSVSFNFAHLTLVNEDILKFDLRLLPKDYKVVANIPYYLTSHLIKTLSESDNPPRSITLLVQKEVAERIAAGPGDMSVLSISAQFYYEVELGKVVPAKLFNPSPKVDSQVVRMQRKPASEYAGIDTSLFFRVVKAGFAARRKKLLNSLSGGLDMPKEKVLDALKKLNIGENTRAQELSVEDWINLSKHLTR